METFGNSFWQNVILLGYLALKRDSRQTKSDVFILLCVINKGHLDVLSTAGFSPSPMRENVEKHKYSGALSIMFKNAFANLQRSVNR